MAKDRKGGSPPKKAKAVTPPPASPGTQQADVYGDLFNLGPATANYASEDAAGLFQNPFPYFDDSCPVPTSSWDVLPTISNTQDLAAPIVQGRCSTPMSNYSTARGDNLGVGAQSPYDPNPYAYHQGGAYAQGTQPAQGMFAAASGSASDGYAPMGSYGGHQGAYHAGRMMRYGGGYAVPPYAGEHPHHHLYGAAQGHGMPMHQQLPPGGMDHRSRSHYAASTTMGGSLRETARPGAAEAGESKRGQGPAGKQGGAAGAKDVKSNKRKGMASAPTGGEQAAAAATTSYFPPQGVHYHHPHQGMMHGGVGYYPPPDPGAPFGHRHAVAPGPSAQVSQNLDKDQQGALRERDCTPYIRHMVWELQRIVSMLDYNTRKNISESLLRLAVAKDQNSGDKEPRAPPKVPQTTQEEGNIEAQKALDRYITQMLMSRDALKGDQMQRSEMYTPS